MLRASFTIAVALLLPTTGLVSPVHLPHEQLSGYELSGDNWCSGSGFVAATFYVVDGVLREQRPVTVESRIDLRGGFEVPLFGEAHTHRPAGVDRLAEDASAFLHKGVFYTMNQGSLVRHREAFADSMNRPDSIDACLAGAMIASPQSHAVDLWQRLVAGGRVPGITIDELEGDAYFVIDSSEEFERRWPVFLASEPDFVKIMVEFSDEYESRRDEPAYFGRSGLDPALVPEIVRRSHDAELRVSAHIETAADFHCVITAGVDIVAHLPGYDIPEDDNVSRYRIAAQDAALAAERATFVVTTTLLSVDRAEGEPTRLERIQANQVDNLELLVMSGVPLIIGRDQYSQNAADEALNLASLDVFDNSSILSMLCNTTPRAIFPERHIGVLEDGAEASFLVLEGDPIEDLEHIRDITLRVKNGVVLEDR